MHSRRYRITQAVCLASKWQPNDDELSCSWQNTVYLNHI